mmetsp:Transcript_27531/g.79798  ORF Transcript_27531/g.79798 Transcript_27531/m.79798 type:complete len:211 (+) Transcript_27531:933-1565(+)
MMPALAANIGPKMGTSAHVACHSSVMAEEHWSARATNKVSVMMSNCSIREAMDSNNGCAKPTSSFIIFGLCLKYWWNIDASTNMPRMRNGMANARTQCWYPVSQDEKGTASKPKQLSDTQFTRCSCNKECDNLPPHLMSKSRLARTTSCTAQMDQPGVTPRRNSPSNVKSFLRNLMCKPPSLRNSSLSRRGLPKTSFTFRIWSPGLTWAT